MWEELKTVYKGKKIFLTGHTGFKGSWLLKTLSMLGAEVKGYALAPENEHDLYHVINGDDICDSIIADLRDKEKLIKAVMLYKPDFIFHLAAQPLVRLSYQIPAETFDVNVIGTANLLDAIKLSEQPCNVVMITTDKVYHNNEWLYPYRESDALGGYDPYSASKACMELLISSYRNSFFNKENFGTHHKAVAVARAGNVIGGGDWAKDRLIPDIIRALSKREKIEIRNPDSIRPWQHVLEPLLGYLMLGAKLQSNPDRYSTAYNFGPNANDALPVIDMVKLAIESWKTGEYFVNRPIDQPHEAGLLKLDISKAIGELGWAPKNNAAQAVQITINWYKEYFENRGNIIGYTERQIENFMN